MPEVDDTEVQARHIQRDIERTREEMDETLTELERRLAPSEILHSGAETLRARIRDGAMSTVDAVKRHPVPIAVAAALVGARLALRPTAADRRRRRAQQDLERALAVFGAGFARAKERSQAGASTLRELGRDAMNHPDSYATPALRAAERLGRETGARTWHTMQRAVEESRAVSRALGREAATYPLGALVVFGVATYLASLGMRGLRG
jgi:hypothetical protein